MVYKAFKYPIYPNDEQKVLINKTFGCCRFVYNKVLEYCKNKYETEGVSISFFDCGKYLRQNLKVQYPWLKEVDSASLDYTLKNLDEAYKRFFSEHKGYPKFKSKENHKLSYTTYVKRLKSFINMEGGCVNLPKMKGLSIDFTRPLEGTPTLATISLTSSGKYYISILTETEHIPLPKSNKEIGLSFGLDNVISTSEDVVYPNVKAYEKYERKLKRLQRKLSRRQKDSKNYEKQRKLLAKCHEKIANVRKDSLHKISKDIICDNQVIHLVQPDISSFIKNNPELTMEVKDASWYELYRQLVYKADWNKRKLIQENPKEDLYGKCSHCGHSCNSINQLTPNWVCPNCGTTHDTHINFAKNILVTT